jgi:hypothetical protein
MFDANFKVNVATVYRQEARMLVAFPCEGRWHSKGDGRVVSAIYKRIAALLAQLPPKRCEFLAFYDALYKKGCALFAHPFFISGELSGCAP